MAFFETIASLFLNYEASIVDPSERDSVRNSTFKTIDEQSQLEFSLKHFYSLSVQHDTKNFYKRFFGGVENDDSGVV